MCHMNDSICKTSKAALLKVLEQQIETHTPECTDVKVFDGFFMLLRMKEIPVKYGNITTNILQMFCANNAKLIIIAVDRYICTSLSLRGMEIAQFHIEEPQQVHNTDFHNDLKKDNFKEALVNFLLDSR